MTNTNKIVAALAAALTAGAIGGGIAIANAAPPPPPPAPTTVVDTPEPGDAPDVPGVVLWPHALARHSGRATLMR